MITSRFELVYMFSPTWEIHVSEAVNAIYIFNPYNVPAYKGGASYNIDYRPIGEQQCK